jgi:hypothetical protein
MEDSESQRLRKMEQERKRLIAQHERDARRAANPNFFSNSISLDEFLVSHRERTRKKKMHQQAGRDERRAQISKRRGVRLQRKEVRAKQLAKLHLNIAHRLFSSRKKH